VSGHEGGSALRLTIDVIKLRKSVLDHPENARAEEDSFVRVDRSASDVSILAEWRPLRRHPAREPIV
jgi:hypothetical protein